MAQKIYLVDALKQPHLYGDLTRKYVDYKPEEKTIWIGKNTNGCERADHPRTEKLRWWPVYSETNPFIVSGVTKFELSLCGLTGWTKLEEALQMYATLYDNEELGAVGTFLSRSRFEKLPEHLKNVEGRYWLCEKFWMAEEYASIIEKYYAYRVDSGYASGIQLYHSEAGDMKYTCGIRNIVVFPKEIQVIMGDDMYDGSSPDRALKLVRG